MRVRSSNRRYSIKKATLKNYTKFTRKLLFHSLFFNKVTGLSNFIEKANLTEVSCREFCETFINTFFTEKFRLTVSSV